MYIDQNDVLIGNSLERKMAQEDRITPERYFEETGGVYEWINECCWLCGREPLYRKDYCRKCYLKHVQ